VTGLPGTARLHGPGAALRDGGARVRARLRGDEAGRPHRVPARSPHVEPAEAHRPDDDRRGADHHDPLGGRGVRGREAGAGAAAQLPALQARRHHRVARRGGDQPRHRPDLGGAHRGTRLPRRRAPRRRADDRDPPADARREHRDQPGARRVQPDPAPAARRVARLQVPAAAGVVAPVPAARRLRVHPALPADHGGPAAPLDLDGPRRDGGRRAPPRGAAVHGAGRV
ncbi:MAG: FIG004556: membrane metalloprotease, partial [uncultured Gemmatimonadaceae bacterium]